MAATLYYTKIGQRGQSPKKRFIVAGSRFSLDTRTARVTTAVANADSKKGKPHANLPVSLVPGLGRNSTV